MTNGRKDGADLFAFYYGKESPLRPIGKILLFPFIAWLALTWILLEALFIKPSD